MVFNRIIRNFTEEWYRRGDEQSQNRRNLLFANYTVNIIANIVGASFFTGLLINMNADDGFIGKMTIISVSMNLLQMFAPLLLERFKQRKKLLMAGRAVIMFINIVFIGLIPLFPASQQLRLSIMALAVLILNFFNAIVSPGITVWFISFTPVYMRAKFFSVISMTNGIVVALAAFGAGTVVDIFKARGMELAGLEVVRGIALLIAVVDFLLLVGMKEYPYENTGGINIKQLLIEPFKERLYLRTVAIAFLWNLTANIPGAFYTIYLLKDLGVNYSFLMLMGFINMPVLIFLTPVWTRFLKRFSWFKTLAVAMALYLLHYTLLAFITGSTIRFLYPIALLYAYTMALGINLAFTNIPYVNIPAKNQTLFIGFYSTIANLGALIGVTVGNSFIAATRGKTFTLIGVTLQNKQYLLLFTALMMLVAVAIINALRKGAEKDDDL